MCVSAKTTWVGLVTRTNAFKDQAFFGEPSIVASLRNRWHEFKDTVLRNIWHWFLEASNLFMTFEQAIYQPRNCPTFPLPANNMSPFSVAGERANRWCRGEDGGNSREWLRFPLIWIKIKLWRCQGLKGPSSN